MDSGMFGKALGRVFAALVLVLLVAGVARAAYMLLAPLVPVLVTLVVLGVIYWVVFRGIRR
ncbi:hypothetical protein KIF24_24230 [Micromonospora sp. Llam7]|uniref:hypothetical protein n=1 Tax=Micromonospora tarapacensis TaxID=2835305 RepID=UPI001C830786|nr:hypothetical protein [Micromonospora tarapacensis]MBX7268821.1 hypothetical protein [Micromonospora tarapacensis]